MNSVYEFRAPPAEKLSIVDQGLDLHLRAKRAHNCLKWGSLNLIVLVVLLADISNKCPHVFSKWFYVEYALTILVGVNIALNVLKYIYYTFLFRPVKGTKAQKNLLNFDEADNSFFAAPITPPKKVSSNTTLISWHSSFNDSNRSFGSLNWSFNRQTPPHGSNTSPSKNYSFNNSISNKSGNASKASINNSLNASLKKYSNQTRPIVTEAELDRYLKKYAEQQKRIAEEMAVEQNSFNNTPMNSFWNYSNTPTNLFKNSGYQVAPLTDPISPTKHMNIDDIGTFVDSAGNSEFIKKISLTKLSHYVTNLRMWISLTILQRLEREINSIDATLKSKGLVEMQCGCIGIERLKKTAENEQFVSQTVPMLPLIVPFLDLPANQQYLVQRIKDLAKGSCIADYRWNSGSPYYGLHWDDHLPTDSAIIFHLFCTYLDTQLMPLPQPGGRPFFNRYVILGEKNSTKETLAEVKNKAECAILCSNLLKPKFNFISDNKIHKCSYDRNNLFYVILQFLIYMKTQHDGLLEGVNLGKCGINILCVIED